MKTNIRLEMAGTRRVLATGLPKKHEDDPAELFVKLDYVDDNAGNRVHKAVALDHQVIPHVIRCVNERDGLVAMLREAAQQLDQACSSLADAESIAMAEDCADLAMELRDKVRDVEAEVKE